MSKKEKRSYNNVPLQEGEVLVPMLVNDDLIDLLGVDADNVKTWSMAGRTFQVIFYAVSAGSVKLAREQFFSALNELLGEKRDARCLVPQEDGSYKVCPKKEGGNRCPCSACVYNGVYDREVKRTMTLEEAEDRGERLPAGPSAEDTAMEDLLFEDMVRDLRKVNARHAEIIVLGHAGYHKGEIIQELRLRKSQGYEEIRAARRWARRYLFDEYY